MSRLLLVLTLSFAGYSLASEEPGGWVEPGGYDAKAEEAKEQAAKAAEEKKQQAAVKRLKAKRDNDYRNPEIIAKSNDTNVCIYAGKEIRAGKFNEWQNEATKRNLQIDHEATKKKVVFIGSTECTLYAALGSPTRVNRSVTAKYVHKQFAYGKTYIYTHNGAVTSWQD